MQPETLPVFPLPEIILFPGCILPLHIFEPRYRSMIDYCSESGDELAIAPFEIGYKPSSGIKNPPIEKIFGYGKIIEKVYLADGRSNIILEGIGIVELIDYQSMEPFRIAKVQEYKRKSVQKSNVEYLAILDEIIHLTKRILLRDGTPEILLNHINKAQILPNPIDFISSILYIEFAKKQSILSQRDEMVQAQVLKKELETINLQE